MSNMFKLSESFIQTLRKIKEKHNSFDVYFNNKNNPMFGDNQFIINTYDGTFYAYGHTHVFVTGLYALTKQRMADFKPIHVSSENHCSTLIARIEDQLNASMRKEMDAERVTLSPELVKESARDNKFVIWRQVQEIDNLKKENQSLKYKCDGRAAMLNDYRFQVNACLRKVGKSTLDLLVEEYLKLAEENKEQKAYIEQCASFDNRLNAEVARMLKPTGLIDIRTLVAEYSKLKDKDAALQKLVSEIQRNT